MTQNIVILTGAGISAESGLGTFRDKDGLWTRYDLSDVATPEGFRRNPARVHDFYNARRANALSASPNTAHFALAQLSRSTETRVTLITQNVDDLHERAGHPNVIHMHGELMRARCASCAATWDAPTRMAERDRCPQCGQRETRPDIVWFGEIPYHMDQIEETLKQADLFVAIGTSGQVYPAAGFVELAKQAGARTMEINLAPSERHAAFDESRIGPATEMVPLWVDEIRAP